LIPADTIKAVRIINTVCHKIKFIGEEITLENCSGELIVPEEEADIKI
jgi:hypothetical protein